MPYGDKKNENHDTVSDAQVGSFGRSTSVISTYYYLKEGVTVIGAVND